jgi:uncharacterized protein (DUF1697 family)
MVRLRELCAQLGCEDVSTYIASGNVVLTSDQSADELARALERGIEREFGLDVAVVVLTAAELAVVVEKNPFPDADPAALQVAFAAKPMASADVDRLRKLDLPPEELVVRGRQLYLHMPSGQVRRLSAAIDRIVGKQITVRNWRTVETLSAMAVGRS